jgi:hypothetical protein
VPFFYEIDRDTVDFSDAVTRSLKIGLRRGIAPIGNDRIEAA